METIKTNMEIKVDMVETISMNQIIQITTIKETTLRGNNNIIISSTTNKIKSKSINDNQALDNVYLI
jgi:hypothetical protein